MTNWISLSRAAATAAAVLGSRLLVGVSTASAFTPAQRGGAESAPLGSGPSTANAHTSASATSGGPSLVRTIVGLAIVIAVIWGLSWILRQFKSGRQPQGPSGGLASVAALTLSSGRSVHLVRAGKDYVLLGSAEQGVVPIQRYSEQQALEAGLLAGAEPPRSRRLPRLPRAPERESPHAPGAGEPARISSGSADPMRAPSLSSDLLERLRHLTVRR